MRHNCSTHEKELQVTDEEMLAASGLYDAAEYIIAVGYAELKIRCAEDGGDLAFRVGVGDDEILHTRKCAQALLVKKLGAP